MRRLALTAAAWLLVPAICLAGSLSGVATEVTDGDTLTVSGRSVRLQGIDAPERDQPHGAAATMALTGEALDQWVRLEVRAEDRYGRVVAVLYREDRNLNRWLVRQGHAWEYVRYSDDPALGSLEKRARAAGRGLWDASNPIPPWEWRQGRPTPEGGESPEPDRDCSDFASHRAAQRFYESHQPGDPHRLDGDGDGNACESLR